MSVLDTTPATYEMADTEAWTLTQDMAPQLGTGQSVSNPTATLTNLSTGATVTLPDPPTVSGTQVDLYIPGSLLATGNTYLWTTTYTISPTTNVSSVRTVIICQ